MVTRTIGVDLASQPEKTALATIDWTPRGPVVAVEIGVGDDRIVEAAQGVEKVGFDCPFGWPVDFVEALTAYARGDDWPDATQTDTERTRSLRFRETDRVVQRLAGGRWPLSVSSDLIGVVAMRYARIETRLRAAGADVSRDGTGLVAETYPAAALRQWGLTSRGYKSTGSDASERLVALLQAVVAQVDGLRFIDEASRELAGRSHDAFDSVVCALIAQTVLCGDTGGPADDRQQRLAQVEGWIHVPTCGLGDLS